MIKKHFILFLLICLGNSSVFACGFYPYGESVRFNLLKPKMIYPDGNDWFYYTTEEFSNKDYDFDPYSKSQFKENLELWSQTFQGKFAEDEIYYAVYQASTGELKNIRSANKLIQALNQDSYVSYREYLIFAKTISEYNMNSADYWEKETKATVKKRKKAIGQALTLADKSKDDVLKRRYAHLAIRLAYYAEDLKKIDQIYNTYFKADNYIDALDYWALHFKVQYQDASPRTNVEVAMVFMNSGEKRFAVHQLYSWEYTMDEVLNQCRTDEEKIAVNFIVACLDNSKDLEIIRRITDLNPNHPCLEFLVLREINKLENWILTPYYTYFEPHNSYYWYYDSEKAIDELQSALIEDLDYAGEVYDLLNQYKGNIRNGELYAVYAKFLSRDFDGLMNRIEGSISELDPNKDLLQFKKQLWALTVLATDSDPSLEHPNIHRLLENEKTLANNQFLLAISKELEYNNHKTLAALVLSHVNEVLTEEYYEGYYAHWKSPQHHASLDSDYYWEYFYYLDAMYSDKDIQNLIFYLDNEPRASKFDEWLCKRVDKESTRLYDLLGTIFMRKNDLEKAYSAFKQVDDTLWKSGYYYYSTYIHDDPFSNDFYGKYDVRHDEEVKTKYTKPQIVKELMKQIEIVNTSSGNQKAKAAYRVANCYRNMSFYGNAWMMRRYFWTVNGTWTGLEDDEEYFHCKQAQKYYKIAMESTLSKDFRVLSLRMLGLCQSYEMAYEVDPYYRSYYENRAIERLNPSYKILRKDYADYGDMVSSCESFQGLFESIQ